MGKVQQGTGSGCPYAIGDIFHTTNETLPSERWPGTEWIPIETFLLGASAKHTVGDTGGSETHTNTVEEMAPHSHKPYTEGGPIVNGDPAQLNYNGTMGSGAIVYAGKTTIAGQGNPYSIMPPYTAVYIWKRTA